MALVSWSVAAKRDLRAIIGYYENNSPTYAGVIANQLYTAVSRLEHFPNMGRRVPELDLDAFRELIVSGYRVVYLAQEDSIDILAIVHSRQDLLQKLSGRT